MTATADGIAHHRRTMDPASSIATRARLTYPNLTAGQAESPHEGGEAYGCGGGPPSVWRSGRSSRICFRYKRLFGERFRHSRRMLYATFRTRLGSDSLSG